MNRQAGSGRLSNLLQHPLKQQTHRHGKREAAPRVDVGSRRGLLAPDRSSCSYTRTSFRYATLCGRSASTPFRFFKSSTYD